MTELLQSLFSDHGPAALSWALTAIGGLIAAHLLTKVKNEWVRGLLSRAGSEVRAAVLEVSQVYADKIREGRADGKLTDAESQAAKDAAIASFKSNFGGDKALKRLARALGLGGLLPSASAADGWVGSRVEAEVKALKLASPR